jgi:methionyl-tRNA formyltransferase
MTAGLIGVDRLCIHNVIRGLHPWPHAVTFAGTDRLILHRSRPAAGSSTNTPGTDLAASGDHLAVATGEGTLELVEIQVEGKRPMQTREFLAGRPIAVGTLLHPQA